MSRQLDFISSVANHAKAVSSKHGLYASVMIAQACLESGYGYSDLSDPPNHNLFGIKGSYNGQGVMFKTAEQRADGSVYYVDAVFRKYPSYKESFEDNAKLLKNGLSWDKFFYSGTWKERTKSYKDATKWLQGRYATDVKYASKLDGIIEAYGLTKYDIGNVATVVSGKDEIKMSGQAKFKHDVFVYSSPKVNPGKHVAQYKKGEKLDKFDKVRFENGYVWLEYTQADGKTKRYVPIAPLKEVLWVSL